MISFFFDGIIVVIVFGVVVDDCDFTLSQQAL